jgi:hypothetical protein
MYNALTPGSGLSGRVLICRSELGKSAPPFWFLVTYSITGDVS